MQLADGMKTDVFFHHFGEALLEELVQHAHEVGYFHFGAPPVFGGEGVEGEPFDAFFDAEVDDALDGFAAVLVAFGAAEFVLFCPTAVAIHDDGDVFGDVHRGASPVVVGLEFVFAVFSEDGFDAGDVFGGVDAAGGFAASVGDFYHFDAQAVVEEAHLLEAFDAAHFVFGFRQGKVVFEGVVGVGVESNMAAYGAFGEGFPGFFWLADGRDGALGEGKGVAAFVYQHGGAAVGGGFFGFDEAIVFVPVEVDTGREDVCRTAAPCVDEFLDDPGWAKRVVALEVDDE